MKRAFLTLSLSSAMFLSVFVPTAQAWHSCIVECYFYVLEQCDPDDQECLDFGFDDCDGSYPQKIGPRGLTSEQAAGLKPSLKRKVPTLNRAVKNRQSRPTSGKDGGAVKQRN